MTAKPYISLFASALLSSCMTQSPAPIDFKSTQPSFSQSYSEKTVISTEDSSPRISTRGLKYRTEDKNDGVIPLKAMEYSSTQQYDEKPITITPEDNKPKSQPTISTKSIEEELAELEGQQSDLKNDTTKQLTQKVAPIKQEEAKKLPITNESEMIVKPEKVTTEHIEDTTDHSSNISLSMPVHGKIVTKFGDMIDGKKVNGIDFAAPRGSDVSASASGIVVFAGNDPKFGNLVIIKSNNSDTFVAYAHMEDILVSNNEEISNGQVIGHVGSSGDTTTAKLHFALRVGKKPVDPMKYLK